MKVVLAVCNHVVEYNPTPRKYDQLYCRRCGLYRRVDTIGEAYALRCSECKLSHNYGADQGAAFKAGHRHVMKLHSHVVVVTFNRIIYRILRFETEQLKLPDYLQWTRENPDHQLVLKDLAMRSQATY